MKRGLVVIILLAIGFLIYSRHHYIVTVTRIKNIRSSEQPQPSKESLDGRNSQKAYSNKELLTKKALLEETKPEASNPASESPSIIKKEQISDLAEETKPKYLTDLEFLTGFGWGKLHAKDNYNLHPFIVDFDFDLKPALRKLNLNFTQLCQFQIEPFISPVSSPETNLEIGTAFLFKIGILPQSLKFQPYIKAGVGIVYMTQHTREQSTQFNFIDQAGIGMHYFFRKNTAFTFEGRFRHLSNSSIKQPNHGINTYFIIAGITYQY